MGVSWGGEGNAVLLCTGRLSVWDLGWNMWKAKHRIPVHIREWLHKSRELSDKNAPRTLSQKDGDLAIWKMRAQSQLPPPHCQDIWISPLQAPRLQSLHHIEDKTMMQNYTITLDDCPFAAFSFKIIVFPQMYFLCISRELHAGPLSPKKKSRNKIPKSWFTPITGTAIYCWCVCWVPWSPKTLVKWSGAGLSELDKGWEADPDRWIQMSYGSYYRTQINYIMPRSSRRNTLQVHLV